MAGRGVGNGKGKRVMQAVLQDPRAPLLQVRSRENADSGPIAQVVLVTAAQDEIDLTRQLTGVIAHSLWMAGGTDDIQNWVDAERLLDGLLGVPPKPARSERRPPAKVEDVQPGPLPEPAFSPGRRTPAARF